MTIWQLYHNFFLYIWTLFLIQAILFFFVYFFFSQDLFDLTFVTSSFVLLINSHHCFRQQKNAAKIPKNRQKLRRRTENTVRFQQLLGGSAGEVLEGRGWPFLGIPHPRNIFTTERTLGPELFGGLKGRTVWVGFDVWGLSFICIDPQDSDHEQLMVRRALSTKNGACYIRCCLWGNVVPCHSFARSRKRQKRKKTRKKRDLHACKHAKTRRGRGGGWSSGWWGARLDWREASLDLILIWRPTLVAKCVRSEINECDVTRWGHVEIFEKIFSNLKIKRWGW